MINQKLSLLKLKQLSEREFLEVFYFKDYHKALFNKAWLENLKIGDEVAVFHRGSSANYFRFERVIHISKRYVYTNDDKYSTPSKYSNSTGKIITKHLADKSSFLCEPDKEWMDEINKSAEMRIKNEMQEAYERNIDNKNWLEWAHYI